MASVSTARASGPSGSAASAGPTGPPAGSAAMGGSVFSPSAPLAGFLENFAAFRPSSGDNDDSDEPGMRAGGGCTMREWTERMAEVEVYERDLHRLILNFFTVNGFGEAAAEFAQETGLQPDMPLASITRRSQIREAVLEGRMEEALRLIDLVDPQILASNPEVNFLLKQQQLLSLIERGDTFAAIDFAQLELAPCVRQHPDLLPKLEEAMALLAFSDLKCEEAQRLLGGMDQRQQTARRTDEAILDFFNLEQESALEHIAKNALWSQEQVRKKKPLSCPALLNLATGAMSLDGSGEGSEREDPPVPLPSCSHPGFACNAGDLGGSGGVAFARRHSLRPRDTGLAEEHEREAAGTGPSFASGRSRVAASQERETGGALSALGAGGGVGGPDPEGPGASGGATAVAGPWPHGVGAAGRSGEGPEGSGASARLTFRSGLSASVASLGRGYQGERSAGGGRRQGDRGRRREG
ncbi:LisH protein [Toxoplasma gondii ME49]|uniref:LisH protein n=11 Tax=Toxoplasma gondii TaxID=5811 RepID=B6K9F6_TOXGV|nr:LisH protein [Toxoplasma gondii ME49]EPT25784.1 LisH protein [Toxoplasma gondii ME49]ESS35393.1 LisH protein [Toxoplasma gondii VEG]CEL77705.1 TPA: LisH protein [Toxoplasma gondii VEG]|eukprot:XP_002364680.1 LisH protein [Toxoplasma gondii ME49]